jgi:4-hydroxy-tetrahydrodipicolinate synthase
MREMISLVAAGDVAAAERIDESLRPLYEGLAVTTNPIPLKAALNMLGHGVGGLRLPLIEATQDQCDSIREALETAGVGIPATA